MTLSSPSPRANVELESAMRSPEQLAFALPLAAVLGVMIVVSAVATGGSAHMVAIAAVGGFAVCAVIPMALMETFVGRPLRAALRQLRAARDGRPAPAERPLAFGIVGDLVRVAADIRAATLNAQFQAGALARYEEMIAAGDDAIRAFRQQAQEFAASATSGEQPSKRSAPSQVAELADAIKTLRASLPGQTFDGAVERIETMLVYLAESMERSETRDKRADETLVRVERAFAEIPRIVARETESVGSSLAGASLSLRNELAAAFADDKTAQALLVERFESFETRVLARLADIGSADIGKFAELVRHEADSTRRALRERLEGRAAPAGDEREKARIDEVAADLSRVGESLAQVADQLSLRLAAVDRIADETMPGAQGALEATTQRLATASGDNAHAPEDAVASPDLRSVNEAIASLNEEIGQRLSALEARIAAARESAAEAKDGAEGRALAESVGALAARIEEAETRLLERLGADGEGALQGAQATAALAEAVAALQTRLESAAPAIERSQIEALLQKLADAADALADAGYRLEGGGPADLAPLRAELAALGEAMRQQSEAQAGRLEAIGQQVVNEVVGFERDEAATTLTVLLKTTKDLRGAIDRLEAFPAAAAAPAADGLQAEIKSLGETLASLAARLESASSVVAPAEAGEGVAAALQRVETRLEAFDGAWLKTEISALSERLATQRAGDDPTEREGLRGEVAALAEGLAKAVETQGDRLAAHVDALEATRRTLASPGDLAELPSRLESAATRIHAGAEALAALATRDGADIAALAESVIKATEAQGDRLVARLDDVAAGLASNEAHGIGEGVAEIAAGVSRAVADLSALVEAKAQGEADRVIGRIEALETGALGSMRDALAGLDLEALRAEIVGVSESLSGAVASVAETLGARIEAIDAGPIDNARRALGAASVAVAESETRLNTLAQRLDGGLATLATAAAAGALDFAALRGEIGGAAEAAARAGDETATRLENLSKSLGVGVAEGLKSLSGAIGGLVQASGRWSELSRQIEGLAAAASQQPDFDALAQTLSETASGAVHEAAQLFEEASRAQAVRLVERFAEFDRGVFSAMLAAFDAMTTDLAETRLRLDRSVEAVSNAARSDSEQLAVLGDEFARTAQAVLAGAERVDQRLETLDARELGPAVAALGACVEEIVAALSAPDSGRLAADVAGGVAAQLQDLADGQAERLAAMEARVLGEIETRLDAIVASGATQDILGRFDEFAAALRDDLAALEARIAAASTAVGGAEAGSAFNMLRIVTRDLNEAVERFDLATGLVERRAEALRAPEVTAATDSETVWALASAVGQNNSRLDALAREQAERFDGLEARLGRRGASSERSGVAAALKGFRAMTRTLQAATGRFEATTTAPVAGEAGVEAPGEPADELAVMKKDLAAALGRLEETAATLSETPPAPALDAALLGDLRGDLRQVGATVAEALAQFAKRLDAATASPREAEAPRPRHAAPGASSALAKIVLSLADSLDLRFSEIESTISELSRGLPAPEGLARLAEQAAEAAAQLKTGLSAFAEASAALAADMSAEAAEGSRAAAAGAL